MFSGNEPGVTTLFTDHEAAFCENVQISMSEIYYKNEGHVFQIIF